MSAVPRPDGVTGNAIVLLGYLSGVMTKDASWYEIKDVDARNGRVVVECVGTGNTYQLSIVQLTGPAE